jgi:DNA polymerase-1
MDGYDTLLICHMINENSPWEKSLENCAQKYIKKGKTQKDAVHAFAKAFGWSAVPAKLMRPYACGDAEVTLELWEKVWRMFQTRFGDEADTLWQYELEMNNALFQMENSGIAVDQKFCRQYQAIATMEMDQIEQELGFAPSKTTALAKFLFDELHLPILELTPGGKPSMAKRAMEDYERILGAMGDHRARLVLDYRGWQKATSSFYTPFQRIADSSNRIHCNYKQHGTATGRLSCSEPNLQQIPRQSDKAWNGRIRTAFLPNEGYKLVGFDYSQLELRLAAAYGGEQWLIEEFSREEADPFTALAERIGTDRYTAKTFTYGVMYGAGLEKTAKILGKKPEDIEQDYRTFLASIPGIMKAKRLAELKTRQRGYIRYWTGRRRHIIPDDSYKAWNALLQGGAAEVVKRVLVQINRDICDDNCRLLLQIHDELVFEIRDDMVEKYSAMIVPAMETLPTEFFGTKFQVSPKEWG